VSVRVEAGGSRLSLAVTDNGIGLAEEVARSGLANMRDRAARLGGTFDARRGDPDGSVVEWSVPI
jgi:signal transduction histidine kinase